MALNQLSLSLQFGKFPDAALHRAALPRHSVARWIRHALQSDAEITVRIVGADEGQALNRDYRGKDYATNVLTFDYTQAPFSAPTWCCAHRWWPGRRKTAIRPCRRITLTCSSTPRCTRRAMTMKRTSGTRW